MKKMTYIVLFFILIVTLAACNMQVSENMSPSADEGPQSTEKDVSKPYVKGVENVDVLDSHGSIEGIERMRGFYEDVQKGVPTELRLVRYTIEGDPIISDLTYDGKLLEVKYDTTHDAYGSGTITTTSCSNLIEEVNPTNTSYIAVDCNNDFYGMEEILQISYNMNQQDLFEFELVYGVNLENEINTLTNTIKKENSATGTPLIQDFVMAADVKQEVYKRLVFANYLAEKDLVKTCKSEDAMNFSLKVHINSGQREVRWNACDHSMDGVKFNDIANYIIEQSEQEQGENQQVTVQGYVLERRDNTLLIGEDLNKLDYEWIKDEIHQLDLNAVIFDFILLEDVHTEEFNQGDKIQATIEGSISGSKPGKARVKEIKKIE